MERLKLAGIEAKPKRLVKSLGWFETVRVSETAKSHLEIVFDCITSGTPVPHRYYRKNRESTPDWLLSTHGILYLHVGHANSRELLFAIQYVDAVFLLGLTDHAPFNEDPIGFSLVNRAKEAIRKYEDASIGGADAVEAETPSRAAHMKSPSSPESST